MTDNEIIKVLKRCGRKHNEKNDTYCKECQFKSYLPCVAFLCDRTIDLINRQKEEILELQKRIINWRTDMDYRPDEIKSEAIKEFAHLVIDRSRNGVIYASDIPDLVKEMVEVETNQRKEDEGK